MHTVSDRAAQAERLGLAGKALIRVPEAAGVMGVPVSTLRQWIADGRFPSVALPNGRTRVAVDDILGWMEQHRRPVRSAPSPDVRAA